MSQVAFIYYSEGGELMYRESFLFYNTVGAMCSQAKKVSNSGVHVL